MGRQHDACKAKLSGDGWTGKPILKVLEYVYCIGRVAGCLAYKDAAIGTH